MLSVGLDVHKKYSYFTVMNEQGKILLQGKIANDQKSFKSFFRDLKGPVQVVMEAGRNWYYFYELLEGLVSEVKLAHPLKTRAIAEAKIKTDKIDSSILAHLSRADLLPEAYIPSKEIRRMPR